MAIKYQLPPFLEGELTCQAYVRWLHRKAQAHARRDRKRSGPAGVNTLRAGHP